MDPLPLSTQQLLDQAGWIQSLARKLIQDEASADDLAQDTLLAAIEHRPTADRPLRPWLARVLRNRRKTHARRDAGRTSRERSTAREEALPSSQELASRAETQRRLVDEVLGLDDPYRSVLLLRYFEGLEVNEIAERRNSTPGSVRGQLSRATARLRERLDHGDEGPDWRLALLPLSRGEVVSLSTTSTLLSMSLATRICLATALATAGFFALPDRGVAPVTSTAGGGGIAPEQLDAPEASQPGTGAAPRGDEAGGSARAPIADTVVPPAPSPSSRPLAGRLGVRGTAGLLRYFQLDLRRGGEILETFVTDETGTFTGIHPRAAGSYELVARDHPDLDFADYFDGYRRHERRPEAFKIEWSPGTPLELSLQPRLEFDLLIVGPEEAVESIAEISLLSYSNAAMLAAARGGISIPVLVRAPVRTNGDRRWVRFAPLHVGSDTVNTLRIESADGLWVGEVPAPEVEEAVAPITFHLESRGGIELRIPWDGDQDPGELQAHFTKAEGFSPAALKAAGPDGSSTLFTKRGLLPGDYDLTAWAPGTDAMRRTVRVRPGEITRATIELDYPESLHTLQVRVASETGEYHGMLALGARAGEGRRYGRGTVEWTLEDGTWVGLQELGPMPPGDYDLMRMLAVDPVRWKMPEGPVRVPGPPVEILCLDAEAACTLVMRVLDSETGAPLTRGQVWLRSVDLPGYFGLGALSDQNDRVTWSGIPVQARLTWEIEAPGYELMEGDWAETPLLGGQRTLEVRVARKP